jgi:tetratricopeptide (TPR) repeat protein
MPRSNHEKPAPADGPADVKTPSLSAGRRWIFRLAAFLIIPVLFIAVPEIGLRIAGVGHPTGFFLKRKIGGRPVYVENADFGLRFFPPELARTASPVVMPVVKTPGTYRIFILGESAALGDPEPAFGFGRYLGALLGDRYPGAKFEVVCTAVTAINSHVILPIARDCAQRDGDLWIVYMGNNEFVGPFGPATVFGAQTPSLGFIRANVALKKLRLVQWLEAALDKENDEPGKAASWGGMKMFLDHQVVPGDPRRETTYRYFQRNLDDILDLAAEAGAKVVLSTVGSNIKDCAPFASTNSASLTATAAADWRRAYSDGLTALANGNHAAAAAQFQVAAQLDDTFAALHYANARCQLALGNRDEAAREFERARDLDTLPFRADTRLNKIIGQVGARRAGPMLAFVDGAAAISAASGQGIAGGEYLYEHVHLNFEGNYLLARSMVDSVARLLPASITDKARPGGEWASFDECSRRLVLSDWDRRRVYDNISHRLAEPPFINQLDHTNQVEKILAELAAVRSRIDPAAARRTKALYEEALKSDASDFHIIGNYAKFLEDIGDLDGAIAAWQRERDLLPFEAAPYFFLGKLQARKKRTDEALANLSAALKIRPDIEEALEEKGRLLIETKRPAEAIPPLLEALRLQPSNARIYLHLANAHAAKGDRDKAFTYLQQALVAQPNLWEAHYFLGVELAAQNRFKEARQHFADVVRLRPDYALGRFNYAVTLAKEGKREEAIVQLQETVRLDPGNRQAAQYLRALQPK